MGIAYPTSISMISTNKVFNDFNLSCGGILHRTISTASTSDLSAEASAKEEAFQRFER